MIDVFLRWYPTNDLRYHFARAVHDRLHHMPDVNLRTVGGGAWSGINVPNPFHINSKKYAEENATTDIYCVIDDDQLPLHDDFFSYGAAVLASHPEYGMLAGFPLEYARQGEPYAAAWANAALIVEAHSIGCPYWVRKGTLKHFPDSPIHMYDGDLSKVVTDKGLKTGLMPAAVYNHLGYGFSQVGQLQQ